jgi:hypothetical protein
MQLDLTEDELAYNDCALKAKHRGAVKWVHS